MNINYTKLTIYSLSILVSFALVPSVSAEEINVTGNGAESQNNVTVEKSTETQSTQSNQLNVTNNVESKAETGNNSASNNTTGDQKIITGDAVVHNEVTNEGNKNTVSAGCCETSNSSITVSGNGAGSQNTVTQTNTTQTSVSVYNNATIVNNISIKANTGKNRASNNTGGDTIIKTGDIVVKNEIINGPMNVNTIKVVEGSKELKSFLKIAGNGAFSENIVTENIENETVINEENFASLFNNVEALMNTGENEADYNTGGDTFILTGDIFAETVIENIVNFNFAEVVCGCEKEKPQQPEKPKEEVPNKPEAPAPQPPSVGGPGPGPSAPGAPAPTELPVTGNNLLFFLLLANVLMFFLGTYLRLRSGRSPGYSVAL